MSKYEIIIKNISTKEEKIVEVIEAEDIIDAQRRAVRKWMISDDFNWMKDQLAVRRKGGKK